MATKKTAIKLILTSINITACTAPFSTEAEVLSTADAIVAHISSCSFFITEFTLVFLTAGPARRILCYIILYQILSPLFASCRASTFFLEESA